MDLSSIFSDLDKFGLAEVAAKQEPIFKPPQDKKRPTEEKKVQFDIHDYVFEKKFTCPVCQCITNGTVVREKKTKIEIVEFDLHIKCTPIDPIYYDIVVCLQCGYSAVKSTFDHFLPEKQAERIIKNISPNFKNVDYPTELTLEMALERYKLALLSSMVKQAKEGEKAYLCMKLTWLYRIKTDNENMKKFAALAIAGFQNALAKESLPIMGLSDNTIFYVMSAFHKLLEDYDSALRLLSNVVVSKTATDRLKDKARDLKTEIITLKSINSPVASTA
ncbi:MAG: DUF2225 domain-containing protein [Defluviitaleaceae bacterium]|nr:DUF2225 domain-containing protein [Defluviitaleaceae bacterium]